MRRTLVTVIGIALCLSGISLRVNGQIVMDEKTLLFQEMISWIKLRLEKEQNLELLNLMAVSLQKLIPDDHQLVTQAYAQLLKNAWEQKNESYVYEALQILKNYENKVVLSLILPLLSEISTIDPCSRSWRGWERSQKLASEILDRAKQQISIDELYELVISEKSVISVKRSALYVIAQKPEEATKYLLHLIKFVETQQGQALFADIVSLVDKVQPLPKQDWEICISLLEAGDQKVQFVAARALARVASELGDLPGKAIPAFVKLARSPNRDLSDLAASVLCNIAGSAPESSLPALIELLQENPSRTRLAQTINKMAPIPEDKIDVLVRIIASQRWYYSYEEEVGALILGALLKSGHNAENIALNFIKDRWIKSSWTEIPLTVIKVLGTDLQRCDAELAEYLLRYKGNFAYEGVYAKAFRRASSPTRLTQAIRDEIEDCLKRFTMKNPDERRKGADILAWMGPIAAFAYEAVLVALEKETVPEVQKALCQALIEMGVPERTYIQRLMSLATRQDKDSVVRQAVATILGNVPVDVAIQLNVFITLQKMAEDNDPAVRKAALGSLTKLLREL